MPRNIAPRPHALVACSIAVLCCSVDARAQGVDANFDPGANQVVNAIAVQPDGKIVVAGSFTGLGGGTGTTPRNRIGRLFANGIVETSFDPGTNGPVLAVVVQPDGKILIGGNFTSVGGGNGLATLRSRIARFNADGSVDLSFNPGVSGNVWALALQPDGKILVGGEFTTLSGTLRNAIGRLNADGSIDAGFNPGATKTFGNPIVYTIALQADGKIVAGGYFNGLGGATRNYIGRINADGAVDMGFDPGAVSISGVNALALQADGKILVGGSFTRLGLGGGTSSTGSARSNIGRINPDGSVDMGFNPGAESQVLTLAVQADGRILLGGYFKWLGDAGGQFRSTRNYIGRLNAAGFVDGSFNPGAGNVVNTVALQPDEGIVAGGLFVTLGGGGGIGIGTPRRYIGRLSNSSQPLRTRDGDFDGDGRADLTVFRPSNGTWYVLQSGSNYMSVTGMQWGNGLDVPVPGDYDGDRKVDIAVFRPSNGTWYISYSGTGTLGGFQWGNGNDTPVPGDYDGDGLTDIAVFRPSNGTWYVRHTATGATTGVQWGNGQDRPAPGDYDGDGLTDIAVFRPSNGTWFLRYSATGSMAAFQWGNGGDVIVPGDYDGDGRTDVAVFRPASGLWYVLHSGTGTTVAFQWGNGNDVPVPGDYDGDGKADIAVFRPSDGTWYLLYSGTATTAGFQWGNASDIPILKR